MDQDIAGFKNMGSFRVGFVPLIESVSRNLPASRYASLPDVTLTIDKNPTLACNIALKYCHGKAIQTHLFPAL